MKRDIYIKLLFLSFFIVGCTSTSDNALKVVSNQQNLAANQQQLVSKLSDDIGKMADRIVVTENLIVHVTDSALNKTPDKDTIYK